MANKIRIYDTTSLCNKLAMHVSDRQEDSKIDRINYGIAASVQHFGSKAAK